MSTLARQEDMLPTLWQDVELTRTGLRFKRDVSFEEWQDVGERLRFIESSVGFWIGDWINYGEAHYGEKYAQAVEETGLSYQGLADMAWTAKQVDFSLRKENLPFSHHKEVASLPPPKQAELLDLAEQEQLSVRDLRQKVREAKWEIRQEEVPLPQQKYRVLYADPPWQYGNRMPGYFTEQSDHYPTMTLEELYAMPVSTLTEPDAVLFLWVTSPILRDAFALVDAWGFEYKASFVWDKVKHNMGHYNSVRHELLLVCTRGSCQPDKQKLFDSVVSVERGDHSEKPEEFREIIDTLYPNGRRLELFARRGADGWDAYGNEIS